MLGKSNPIVRRVRALRRDPALRRSQRVFVAEGLHLAEEALRSAASIELLLVSPALGRTAGGRRLMDEIDRRTLVVHETSDAVLRSLQDAHSPQPVLAVVRREETGLSRCLGTGETDRLLVVLHGIQDPGNLGAILRSADAAGADGALVAGESADPYHPRSVRASMGSIFRLPPVAADADSLISALRERGIRCIGTHPTEGRAYFETDLGGSVALFLGRESQGLPPELSQRLDLRVTIPMREGVDSLSVGAAAAVLLFETARQRGPDRSGIISPDE